MQHVVRILRSHGFGVLNHQIHRKTMRIYWMYIYIYREREIEIHIYWKIFWCSSKYNKLHIMIVYPIVYLILSTGRFYDNVLWRYLLGLPWRCHQWLATEVSLSGTSGTARDRQADMWVWVNGWSPRKKVDGIGWPDNFNTLPTQKDKHGWASLDCSLLIKRPVTWVQHGPAVDSKCPIVSRWPQPHILGSSTPIPRKFDTFFAFDGPVQYWSLMESLVFDQSN